MFSTINYNIYLLSKSTVFNSASTCYLVNYKDLLILELIKETNYYIIKLGIVSYLVIITSIQVFKNLL